MAERTATRSSNRLNTPQSPFKVEHGASILQQTAPRRSTRATRSQSRDVSDSEVGKPGAKGGRRGGRQANASNAPARKGKGKNDIQASTAQVDPNLSQVPEETNVEYPELKPNFLNGLAQAASQVAESPYTAFSGTTARTSRSAHEHKGYSAFDLLDALPDLSYAADKVLSWLVPENEVTEEAVASICNELQNNGSRTSKNVSRLGRSFETQKDVYGGESFINPSVVVSALLGSNDVQGTENRPWRPDPLLLKANLTTLLVFITRLWEIEASARLVEFLDQNFPIAFVGQSFAARDFGIALEIRTQHFILQLARYVHQLNFDPDLLLSQVFQNNPTTFKGWNSPGLQAEELSDEQKRAIGLRFQELGQNFSDGNSVDPQALKNAYPWIPFVVKVMAWSKERLADIETQVHALGGASDLIKALDQEIHGRITAGLIGNDGFRNDIQLEYPSPSQLSNTTSEKSEVQKRAGLETARRRTAKLVQNSAKTLGLRVARLKEMEKTVNAKKGSGMSSSQAPQTPTPAPTFVQPFAAAVAPMSNHTSGGHAPTATMIPMTTAPPAFEGMTGPPLVDDDWQPEQIDDNMDQMQPNPFENGFATSQQIVQMGEEREAAANKENMADPAIMQGSASPGTSQRQILGPRKLGMMDPQPNAQRVMFESQVFEDMAPSSTGAKRDFSTMDAEGGELEEPSQDQGFQQDNRTFDVSSRRAQKSTTGRTPQRRTKRARTTQATQDTNEAAQDYVPEPMTQDDNGPPQSTLDAYQRSKSKAQEQTAARPKKVQVRKAWTDEETGLLLDLIEEHGTSWRLLKQIDMENNFILKDRDQVALKDKARNMKLDFLKAGSFLPLNFEHVPLNKLQIQKLHELRIEYHQDAGRRRSRQPS